MKPANFPERVNARRKVALRNLRLSEQNQQENQSLSARVADSLRDVRSKKNRAGLR